MQRFAVVLVVLGLSACATTREDQGRLGDERAAPRALAMAAPTPATATAETARSADAEAFAATAIRDRGLLDPDTLARVNRKSGEEALMAFEAADARQLSPRGINELRVHTLPVGAGSCHLLECPGPGNELLLYDCGSTEANRARFDLEAVQQYIGAIAGERPVKVVISHADRDLYSHVAAAIAPQRVAELWLGGQVADYPLAFRTWVSAVQDAQQQGTGEVAAALPAGWHNDGFAIEQLGCGTALSYVITVGVGDEKNDQSLVLSVDHGSFRVLLTGDATGETQNVAMQNFPAPLLDSTVVTAAHHGAQSHGSNDDDWAQAVRPAIIIYSAGESHAHPRCPVLEAYRATGALMAAEQHSLRCGTSLGYEPARSTFLSEYNTFDSGVIVVTSGAALDELRVECWPADC